MERLRRIAAAIPEAAELARAVSLCVRAEPELVRALRLILFPRSGAWIEADLYFSPLVGQRTPDWIVLDADLARELREDVARRMRAGAEERHAIGRIRLAIDRAHMHVPFEIRREEEVISLAVERRGGVRRTQAAIDRTLRPLLGHLLESSDESLAMARWFASAARRMPAIARDTEAFALLAFAASSVLGGRRIDPGLKGTAETFEELSRYLPASVKRMPLWTGLTSRGLRFAFAALPGYRQIDVPRTDPVLLEVRAGESAPRLLNLTAGQPFFAPLPTGGDVTIRTLSRDAFRLRPFAAGEPAERTSDDFARVRFDNDVFISHARLDSRWVKPFGELLRMRLSQILGRRVTVYVDTPTPDSGFGWASGAESTVRRSALLLAVVTPGYVDSDYCRRELEAFQAAAREQTGGVIVGSRSRVFPVTLMPLDRAGLPPELASVVGYQFFSIEPETGSFRQFERNSSEYLTRLDDLAQDLAGMLGGVDDGLQPIYVAASADLAQYARRLTRELQAHGYSTSTGGEDLDRARVYVMLAGGMSAESAIEPLLAVIRERPQVRLFVWTPRDPETSDRPWLDDLSRLGNVDLLLGIGFVQFLESLVAALGSPPRSADAPRIYLMCPDEDHEAVQPLVSRLSRRLRVRLAGGRAHGDFRGRLFAGSDGVLIYWGSADRSQVEMMMEEARQSEKPLVLYLGPPYAAEKRSTPAASDVITVRGEESLDSAVKQILRIFLRDPGPDGAA